MSEKVKQCPKCSGPSVQSQERFHFCIPPGFKDWFFVQCLECGIRSRNFHTAEEAVSDWNRRTHDLAEVTSVTLDFSKMSEEDIQELYRLLDSRDDVTISSKFTTTELCQSIISWTRYDGTPETLPDYYKSVLHYRGDHYWNRIFHPGRRTELFKIDDEWAYLPKPQKGMA